MNLKTDRLSDKDIDCFERRGACAKGQHLPAFLLSEESLAYLRDTAVIVRAENNIAGCIVASRGVAELLVIGLYLGSSPMRSSILSALLSGLSMLAYTAKSKSIIIPINDTDSEPRNCFLEAGFERSEGRDQSTRLLELQPLAGPASREFFGQL